MFTSVLLVQYLLFEVNKMEKYPVLKRCSVVLERMDMTPYMSTQDSPPKHSRASEGMDFNAAGTSAQLQRATRALTLPRGMHTHAYDIYKMVLFCSNEIKF